MDEGVWVEDRPCALLGDWNGPWQLPHNSVEALKLLSFTDRPSNPHSS